MRKPPLGITFLFSFDICLACGKEGAHLDVNKTGGNRVAHDDTNRL